MISGNRLEDDETSVRHRPKPRVHLYLYRNVISVVRPSISACWNSAQGFSPSLNVTIKFDLSPTHCFLHIRLELNWLFKKRLGSSSSPLLHNWDLWVWGPSWSRHPWRLLIEYIERFGSVLIFVLFYAPNAEDWSCFFSSAGRSIAMQRWRLDQTLRGSRLSCLPVGRRRWALSTYSWQMLRREVLMALARLYMTYGGFFELGQWCSPGLVWSTYVPSVSLWT